MEHIYICIGPHCWGTGKTADEAYRNARRNLPHIVTLKEVDSEVGLYPAEAQISDFDGRISWPTAHECDNPDCYTNSKKVDIRKMRTARP